MNYAGHEKLRADVAEVANTMCDLRARLNDMEHRCRFDSDVLVERLARQTLYRANRLFMEAYTEILELDSCFKDCKRLVRTVLIFTESSDQLSRATDRVPGLPASPGYVQ